LPARALHLLQSVFGYPAFRGSQAEIVQLVACGGDALVLMPTGGGKSLCYQIPSLLRHGCGIVISPLIALMQDQVDALGELGVRAAFLNSSQSFDESMRVERALRQGELVFDGPTSALTPAFLRDLYGTAADELIDEPVPLSAPPSVRSEPPGLPVQPELFPEARAA
jgi:ATP-dependent DNA helicase RecQ